MERLPLDMIAEINSLQRMDAAALRAKYADLLGDIPRCRKREPLRAEVAYRLQERHYGIGLSEGTRKRLADAGGPGGGGRNGLPLAGTRLVRNWRGRDYEAVVREDGTVEYGEGIYRSLSAVARKITGTNWNGRVFFGLGK